jgi:3-deoxy-manno-octulosonate cytidylyltransferase (CMP-KDO synthetase)
MNPFNILGIIPARYASTRFPGKALIDIAGKSMIQRVYEQSSKAKCFKKIVVATDNELIYNHVMAFGGNVVMTSENHPSGTDRCFEALQNTEGDFDYVINIQGDEPFVSPTQIETLADTLTDKDVEIATLIMQISNLQQITDLGEAKVVLNNKNEAIYFSRSPIPFVRNLPPEKWQEASTFFRHVGMYAYRKDILEKITLLQPSSLEKAESLEQLRWIENGYKIKVAFTTEETPCIDTPEDMEKALSWMKHHIII